MADLTAIKPVITNVLQAMDTVGVELSATLGGMGGVGFKFLGIVFSLMFLYNVFIFMVDGSNKVMVDLTKLLLTYVILASMIIGWSNPIGGNGPTSTVSVSGFFLKAIPDIAEEFTNGKDATVEIVDKYATSIGQMYKVLSPPEKDTQTISDKLINAVPIAGFATTVNIVSGISGGGNAMQNSNGLSLFVSIVILVIAVFFQLWALVTFVFILNAGQLMMYVGLALGPILIPFLLIPKLSFLFDGWLKFMISASLFKVVAVLVGLLSLGTIDAIVVYSNAASTGDENIIFLSLMVLFFAMLGKQMMGLADNIASSIATGGANSGGAGDSHALLVGAARTNHKSNGSKEKVEKAEKTTKAAK